jgi:hypothetical protein
MFVFYIILDANRHLSPRSDGAWTARPPTGISRTLMSNYDQLHRQCRTLENLFDAKLTSYSQLVAALSRPQDVEANGSSERWRDLEVELEDLETKVRSRRYRPFGWGC